MLENNPSPKLDYCSNMFVSICFYDFPTGTYDQRCGGATSISVVNQLRYTSASKGETFRFQTASKTNNNVSLPVVTSQVMPSLKYHFPPPPARRGLRTRPMTGDQKAMNAIFLRYSQLFHACVGCSDQQYSGGPSVSYRCIQ